MNTQTNDRYREAFTLEKWIDIPQLKEHTFDTRFVDISGDEAKALLAFCRYTQQKLSKHSDSLTESVKVLCTHI